MANNHPAHSFAAVTPNDSADLPLGPCRSLFVGVGGDVTVRAQNSTVPVTFKNASAGSTLPINVAQVMATNTTATSLVALY